MPSSTPESTLTAFAGFRRVASGPRSQVIAQLRKQGGGSDEVQTFVFDDSTGERLDLDLRDDASAPATEVVPPDEQATRSVGRPKLGVVAREVTLLPRHWEWLGRQPGGASVALRRLVDEARHVHADRDAQRAAREATYRFMTVIAGDLPGFEEATRALFAGEHARFDALIESWPEDLRAHLNRLAAAAWSAA
ncbi:DUF2239 family protein [Variovorax sp. J2P1-59]|uniref:DUF2239 family protein n=1 Tax=Variovorax flavidus TaxID=3053501 RepID=UPI0025784467|nr:DUF2239 family protein [Variovorax sp. J2P1-59]MDM0073504.1 DUF2239 family protein [Variovorax sp. J2P1-59]